MTIEILQMNNRVGVYNMEDWGVDLYLEQMSSGHVRNCNIRKSKQEILCRRSDEKRDSKGFRSAFTHKVLNYFPDSIVR